MGRSWGVLKVPVKKKNFFPFWLFFLLSDSLTVFGLLWPLSTVDLRNTMEPILGPDLSPVITFLSTFGLFRTLSQLIFFNYQRFQRRSTIDIIIVNNRLTKFWHKYNECFTILVYFIPLIISSYVPKLVEKGGREKAEGHQHTKSLHHILIK